MRPNERGCHLKTRVSHQDLWRQPHQLLLQNIMLVILVSLINLLPSLRYEVRKCTFCSG